MLGMMHKRVLGKCHPFFSHPIPWYAERFPEGKGRDHNKQLYGHWCEVSADPFFFFVYECAQVRSSSIGTRLADSSGM
jgi:hypothetical protein